jgi:hypothetical protein
MHSLAILTIVLGAAAGWTWKRGHQAWLDWRSAIARMKGARKVFGREARITALVVVAAVLVVRGLAG